MKGEPTKEKHHSFIADIEEIRRRAREHMEKGAVSERYKADREKTLIRLRARPSKDICSADRVAPVISSRWPTTKSCA